jgi:hypothetical protein
MKTRPNTKQNEVEPLLVPAARIASRISVTPRYVHMLAEQGQIPVHRFGKACVRFREAEVLRALGINSTEAALAGAAQ